MKKYELIVIGAGTGLDIASRAATQGKRVALIEPGPLGGTCLNRGCIPSKMLIHSADLIEHIKEASKFGLVLGKPKVNFKSIVERVTRIIDSDAANIAKGIATLKNLDWYKKEAKFVEKKVIEVGGEQITAEKIVIAAGTRPFIPPIEGLDRVKYMTSREALRNIKQPKKMIIIGGGYIAAELAHFYGALGTEITILERGDKLLAREDFQVSELFTQKFFEKYKVMLNYTVIRVEKIKSGIRVIAKNQQGQETGFEAESLLVATGRISNADVLNLKEVGYELTPRNYLVSNAAMETSVKGVYTLGDIAGKYFFKHSANHEGGYVWINLWNEKQVPVDYTAMPHAVFSSPQVAGVGKTEQELKEAGVNYKVGIEYYKNTGMGQALQEEDGFVKVLLGDDDQILGCHIVGPEASTLIHEVVVAMKAGGAKAGSIRNTIHVHPALSEVVQRAFFRLNN